jgi:putative endonuclease
MTPIWRAWLNRLLGQSGERAAERFLRRRGYRILTRRYRVAVGEIDLIARDCDTLVFVEVKTRRQGEPLEAVTPEKQRRLTRAAVRFLYRHEIEDVGIPCRFDVVAVVWPEQSRRPRFEHIRHAFEATGAEWPIAATRSSHG